MIVTGARRDVVPLQFEPVLSALSDELAAMSDEVSLYIYGSVATGTALAGSSDVDFLTVALSAAEAEDLAKAMSDRFAALCRGVEIAVAHPEDFVGDGDSAYGNRVFLRHYCVHLQGPDRLVERSPFKADVRAARGFNGDFGRHLIRWRQRQGEAELAAAVLGRIVARKTLLAVSSLVSVHDRTWTTDREGAARRWSEIEPSLARALASLVAWSGGSVQPTEDELHAVLASEGVVDRLVQTFAESIGLWPESA
jgi:hypothetical protein